MRSTVFRPDQYEVFDYRTYIIRWAKKRGVSLSALITQAGCSSSTAFNYLAGRAHNTSLSTIQKLLQAMRALDEARFGEYSPPCT